MDWFYEKDGSQQGPVSEEALKSLVENGTLAAHNLIWREGMADWAPYHSVFAVAAEAGQGQVSCPTCGASVSAGELIPAGDRKVCPHCQMQTYPPADLLQMIRYQGNPNRQFVHGGNCAAAPATTHRQLRDDKR